MMEPIELIQVTVLEMIDLALSFSLIHKYIRILYTCNEIMMTSILDVG